MGANGDEALIGRRVITDNWLRDWSGDPAGYENVGYHGA